MPFYIHCPIYRGKYEFCFQCLDQMFLWLVTYWSLESIDIRKCWCFPCVWRFPRALGVYAFSFVFTNENIVCWIEIRWLTWSLKSCSWVALYTSEFILLLLSAVTSSKNISGPVPVTAKHHHAIIMSDRWFGVLWITNCFSPTPYFDLPIILVQVEFSFTSTKMFFHPEMSSFF